MNAAADAQPRLPPNARVFVRDWLSANNVLLTGRGGNVLVDTGYSTHAPLTLALLASADGIGQAPLALVVNTHGHSDHVGGNASLVRRYGCPVAFPANEADAIERWDHKALLYDYADQRVGRFRVDRRIAPASRHVWGGLEWHAISAPGHDMRHPVSTHGERAFVKLGVVGLVVGPGTPEDTQPCAAEDADCMRMVAAAALAHAYARLAAFEADDARTARHALKVVLAFHLLDCRSVALAVLPAYVDTVGIYRDVNAAVLKLSPPDLALMLVHDLLRAGAARQDGEYIVAA